MSKPGFVVALAAVLGGALVGFSQGEAKAGGDCWRDCAMPERPPVVHRTFKRRIQIEQGVYEIARTPSVYGWVVDSNTPKGYTSVGRRVLLHPYKNILIYQRPRHLYVTERVAIEREGVGQYGGDFDWWDRLWD
jgi:hypothetical protein